MRLIDADRRLVERAAAVLLQAGYDAFLEWIEGNLRRNLAKARGGE